VVESTTFFGQDREASISQDQVLAFYEAICPEFNPRTGAGDDGATLQDALDYWRKTGLGGHTIVAAAQLDPTDLDAIRACIDLFGSVYCGLWVTQSAMDQFDAGQDWTYVKRSRNLGGHCVPIGAYDAEGFECVTWGRIQRMSVEFFVHNFDEVWVPITQEWIDAQGANPSGIDVAALNADFQALTGQEGPFTGVTPAPEPQPEPDPTPSPDPEPAPPSPSDPDATLVTAFETWKDAKGL
jgi:hypothetical protein